MSEEKKKAKRPARQEWKPNLIAQVLYRGWMMAFGAFKIALLAAATVAIMMGICLLAFGTALGDYLEDDIMPKAGLNLDDFALDQTSFVYYYDSNGEIKLLQQLHTAVDRKWADFEDIPKDMINATIAIEDKRFYEHQGVDWFTTIKAFANMFMGDDSKGGSTITQQLIKNLTQNDSVTVQRKLLEIFQATEFEKRYDKDTVLEWYLNYIYLGDGCYGVRAAAENYFGKELEMLTPAECASLIAITNNPSIYGPYSEPGEFHFRPEDELRVMTGAERNDVRKQWTLGEMVTQGWLSQEEYDAAMAQELVFKSGIADGDRLTVCTDSGCGYENIQSMFNTDGYYFYCPICGSLVNINEDQSQDVYSWFVDAMLEDLAKALCDRDQRVWNDNTRDTYMNLIARGGYHIYSTLDMNVQNQVDLIYEDLSQIPETRSGQQLQSAIVIVDNRTGDIVAMAGAVDKKTDHDAFSHAWDEGKQTGSSIKPLTVYGPAFEAGAITPASVITDLPLYYEYDEPYPQNDNRRYSYRRTIFSGLTSSVNAVAANVLVDIGEEYAFDFGKYKFGLTGLTDSYISPYTGQEMNDIDVGPLAMGAQTLGVTVRDMSTAFATFANDGVVREGRTFTKVYDSDGNLILENTQDSQQILSHKSVEYMNYCLSSAAYGGTGYESYMSGWWECMAGKTGTSADSKDRWFCGYTDYYTAAVWTGYKVPETIRTIYVNNPAAVLWNKVMEPLHYYLEPVRLYSNDNFVWVSVCKSSGLLATEACDHDIRIDEDFISVENIKVYWQDRPTEYCDQHAQMEFCVDGDGVANEWCKHFAGEEVKEEKDRIKLEEKSLVRITEEEMEELKEALDKGLWTEYQTDTWIYLVDDRGRDDDSYKGFVGKCNEKTDAPYKVCEKHTEEAWKEYLESQKPEEPEEPTDPNNPDNPGNPTDPTQPPQPAKPNSGNTDN